MILANILGQIKGFVSIGEAYYLWDFVWPRNTLCGCGSPFHECPLWRDVVARAFGGPDRVDAAAMRAAGHRLAGRSRALPRLVLPKSRARAARDGAHYLANVARLYRAVAAASQSRVIVDSSKWPSYGRLLETIPGFDVRVVHLVRDPRAVAYSWLRRTPVLDRYPPEELYRRPANSSARWTAWNAAAELYWSRAPDRYLRVRYEDFVAAPRASTQRILDHVGEPDAVLPFVSDDAVELGVTHTLAGNPNRLRSGRVELKLDDEWKTRMRRADRAVVGALTLPLLVRYRYTGVTGRGREPRARNGGSSSRRRPPARG
jgi:hypothetical protein